MIEIEAAGDPRRWVNQVVLSRELVWRSGANGD